MRYLKYTMTSVSNPFYPMDFDMYPGTFFFPIPAMIAAFRKRIENEVKYDHPQMKIEKSPILMAHIQKVERLKWLESANEGDLEIVQWHREWEMPPGETFWCALLVFGGEYRDVVCPACETSYPPGDTTKLKWQRGGFLSGEGGRRLVCPKQHTLYSASEWFS